MAPTEPPSEITVRVKVPQGHIEGTTGDEFLLGTISTSLPLSSLRQRIQTLVPSNPDPATQRLLFGGRALIDDSQSLADALNIRRDPAQTDYVLHLLIRAGAVRAEAPPRQGLFGNAGAAPRPALFDHPTPQAATSSGLFGNARASNVHGTSNAGEGLFGGMSAQNASDFQSGGQVGANSTSRPGSGLFGSSAGPTGSSLFSSAAAQPGQSLFGSPAAHQSLFGNTAPQPGQPLFGSNAAQSGHSTFGNAPQPADTRTEAERLLHSIFDRPGALPHGPSPFASQQAGLLFNGPGQSAQSLLGAHASGGGPQSADVNTASAPPPVGAAATQDGQPAPGIQTSTNGQPHHHHHHHHGPHHHVHHNHSHGHAIPRPVSAGFHVAGTAPDGHRFTYTSQTFVNGQQTMGQHGVPMPGLNLPFPLPMPFPGVPQAQTAPPGASALDRARENVAEMRRMLETLRSENATEQTRTQVADIEQRMQAINDYIDPFNFGRRARGTSPARHADRMPHVDHMIPQPIVQHQVMLPGHGLTVRPPIDRPHFGPQILSLPDAHLPLQPTELFLLSSPDGPQAILNVPQRGSYIGTTTYSANTPRQPPPTPTQPAPTPTQPAPPPQEGAPAPPAPQAVVPAVVPEGAQPAWLAHFWTLLRIGVFAYIFLGNGLGWRRPLALLLIGLGFWLIRLGLFVEGGVIRRWWEGLTQVQPVNPAPAGVMPTPEQVAQRLIREQNERTPLHRIREQLRPAERALALFIASLWPGIGERYVQALDRAREEEEAARRALEAERAAEAARLAEQAREAEKPAIEGESSEQKVDVAAEVEGQAGEASVKAEESGNPASSPQ